MDGWEDGWEDGLSLESPTQIQQLIIMHHRRSREVAKRPRKRMAPLVIMALLPLRSCWVSRPVLGDGEGVRIKRSHSQANDSDGEKQTGKKQTS